MSKGHLSRRLEVLEQRISGGQDDVIVIFRQIVRPDCTMVTGDRISSNDGAFGVDRTPGEANEDFERRACAAAEQFAMVNGPRAVNIMHEVD